jgi:hypothetical protein
MQRFGVMGIRRQRLQIEGPGPIQPPFALPAHALLGEARARSGGGLR